MSVREKPHVATERERHVKMNERLTQTVGLFKIQGHVPVGALAYLAAGVQHRRGRPYYISAEGVEGGEGKGFVMEVEFMPNVDVVVARNRDVI
jgi:hypothetical protein